MICPKCKSPNLIVIDSRPLKDEVRRRRECADCKYRFTTYEITEVKKARYELVQTAYRDMFAEENK